MSTVSTAERLLTSFENLPSRDGAPGYVKRRIPLDHALVHITVRGEIMQEVVPAANLPLLSMPKPGQVIDFYQVGGLLAKQAMIVEPECFLLRAVVVAVADTDAIDPRFTLLGLSGRTNFSVFDTSGLQAEVNASEIGLAADPEGRWVHAGAMVVGAVDPTVLHVWTPEATAIAADSVARANAYNARHGVAPSLSFQAYQAVTIRDLALHRANGDL